MILAHLELIILIIKISNINPVVKLDIENHADSCKSLLSLWDKIEDSFIRKCLPDSEYR